jgi:hypothetical protein
MLATYRGPQGGAANLPPDRTRGPVTFLAAFLLTTIALMIWPAIDPGLGTFYDRTIAYQAGRDSPFSIWGQTDLEPLRIAIMTAVAALSIALAFRPRRKSVTQVAAFGAALLIGLQLSAQHWFYLYIVWFYPLVLVALATPQTRAGTITCSIESARPRSLTSTTAPITQTSSSAVSKRTGI